MQEQAVIQRTPICRLTLLCICGEEQNLHRICRREIYGICIIMHRRSCSRFFYCSGFAVYGSYAEKAEKTLDKGGVEKWEEA